ncbi:MAG: DNA polymerase III subunit beta [Clostridia bacterium]|nr:DNA polymerase III subunit beta [Clostridia bacterium]
MRFQCNTALLSQACQNVQRAVSTKTSIPAVEGILIKALGNEIILTGYDLDIGINTSINANIEEQGSIILNARVFCEILRRIPFELVKIECDERNLAVISSGDIKYEIMGISADEYPELPSVKSGFPVVISQKILRDMVHQTIFAVASSESKVVYTGIKFELSHNQIKLVAVDGYRMAIRKEAIDFTSDDMTFIVPSKTLAEVVKLAVSDNDEDYISMGVGKRHIMFEIGNYTVISRLLEGEFLNYQAAIPVTSSTTVKVDTRSFIDSVERTSLIITDKTKSLVSCVFDDNYIKVNSVTSLGTANDRIPADIEGNRVEIGFNNRYLLDALRASETDEVKIELNGPISPILILPVQGDSFTFLVLPVRLKKND